jgi:hypothetical protein
VDYDGCVGNRHKAIHLLDISQRLTDILEKNKMEIRFGKQANG